MRPVFILFLLLKFVAADAQTLKKLIEEGDNAAGVQDYFLAEAYFKKAYSIDSTNIDLQFKLAHASLLNTNYLLAERYFEKIYKNDTKKKYPDALFYYAICKRFNSKYKEAAKLFEKYSKRNIKKDPVKADEAKKYAEACNFAMMLMANPLPVTVIHLDSTVNTKTAEFAPFENDSTLYFTNVVKQGKDNESKIFDSEIRNKKYKPSHLFDSLINPKGSNIANLSFNKTGDVIYFSRCELKNGVNYDCAIYQSVKKNNTWQAPEKLNTNINAGESNNTQPVTGWVNGIETMFFASDRANGEGGMDIWMSVKKNNEWQPAINAGKKVNSEGDEVTPYFCDPCQALHFSSDFFKGMGGFDIFKSHYNNGSFEEPENMGYPINSAHNDIYYKNNADRSKAYFASNREGSLFEKYETCCNDIYMIELPHTTDSVIRETKPDTIRTAISKLHTLVPLTLYFNNDEPDSKTLNTTTNKTYTEACTSYVNEKKNYLKAYSKGLKDDEKEIALTQMDDFFEDSVKAGLNDLERFAELMLTVLKAGEKVSITIKGYCSPLASNAYNINLAKRRISSMINFFNSFENGALKPYLTDSEKVDLKIEEIGELKASTIVSDNPNDATNSVYSRAAALERKIAIIAVSVK